MVRISQQQIARELGLSQALVSTALNGRKNQVAPETYAKIWRHAQKVGYRPRGMQTELLDKDQHQQPEGVGFILRSGLNIDSQNIYFSHVQNGLFQFLAEREMHAVFLGSEDLLDAKRIQSVRNVCGVVLFGEVSTPFLHNLIKLNRRVVSISAQYPGWCHSVQSNETQAAWQAVEHLKDLRHKHIAWVGGLLGRQRHIQRRTGLDEALAGTGLTLSQNHILEFTEATPKEGREAGEWLVQMPRNKRPSAVICFNSLMARGLTNHLLRNNISVPEDISIISMDRTKICSEDQPLLTSTGADPESIGAIAGELILESTGNDQENFCDIMVASKLDIQASTLAKG